MFTLGLFLLGSCSAQEATETETTTEKTEMEMKVADYVSFKLTTDLSALTEKEQQMLPLLIEAAKLMDEIFWMQAYGEKDALLNGITDEATRQFATINYGPWDRMDGDKSFIEGVNEKPLGANFYPTDITKEEFEAFESEDKSSLYTLITRNETGELVSTPYHQAYKEQTDKTAELLRQAAELAEDEGLKSYLSLRAEALLSDDYLASDMAWMDMKTNTVDFVVGPIENYEDMLFGAKAAHEAYVLVKDKVWSKRLEKYVSFLPELQTMLPVDAAYKTEIPGSGSDLNAYDVIYYAGDCNAGGKTIAINLPNDERVHLAKGSRRLQLKNAMQAKFDKILVPISSVLIAEDQRQHVQFDAFFANTMFHEVAHGLGVKNTINDKGTAREALAETYSIIEEGKADILGLFMVIKLKEMGELETDLMDNYVTFMAGIFRSIRFGASSSHGKANLMRFNYFKEMGAFAKTEKGTYTVDFDKMTEAINSLGGKILTLQGNGDYEGSIKFMEETAILDADLQSDLDKLKEQNIPVDIVFEQGLKALGLN